MKRTRTIAMILALFLALSACGAGTAVKSADVSAAESETISAELSKAAQLSQTAAPASPNTEGETAMDKITLSILSINLSLSKADQPLVRLCALSPKSRPCFCD